MHLFPTLQPGCVRVCACMRACARVCVCVCKKGDSILSQPPRVREGGSPGVLILGRSDTHALSTTCGLSGSASGGVSFARSLALFLQRLRPARGLSAGPLARVLVVTADLRRSCVSPQPPRGSRGESAPPSRARSWTCSRRSLPRLATLTFSCARRWRSRSTCRSPESRCARRTLQGQGRGTGAGSRGPGCGVGLVWGRAYKLGSPSQTPPTPQQLWAWQRGQSLRN